jgi:hypothetical protein
MQYAVKDSGLEGLGGRSALRGGHCFVDRAIDV